MFYAVHVLFYLLIFNVSIYASDIDCTGARPKDDFDVDKYTGFWYIERIEKSVDLFPGQENARCITFKVDHQVGDKHVEANMIGINPDGTVFNFTFDLLINANKHEKTEFRTELFDVMLLDTDYTNYSITLSCGITHHYVKISRRNREEPLSEEVNKKILQILREENIILDHFFSPIDFADCPDFT